MTQIAGRYKARQPFVRRLKKARVQGSSYAPALTNDGKCDEAPAHVRSLTHTKYLCLFGTDCTDCGVRPFCTICPEACQEHGRTTDDGQASCMQVMWSDGVCDPGCNNYACGHNDCSESEIIDKCVLEQLAASPSISSAPEAADGTSPQVGLTLRLTKPLALEPVEKGSVGSPGLSDAP